MTAMEAFHKRVPDIGMSEYRSFAALGIEGLPRAEYGFMEFYCNDPSCDCRRVQLVCGFRAGGNQEFPGDNQLWMGIAGVLPETRHLHFGRRFAMRSDSRTVRRSEWVLENPARLLQTLSPF